MKHIISVFMKFKVVLTFRTQLHLIPHVSDYIELLLLKTNSQKWDIWFMKIEKRRRDI